MLEAQIVLTSNKQYIIRILLDFILFLLYTQLQM